MPLDKSGSKNSVSKNIKKELSAGKPLKQAQAIALTAKPKIKINKPAPMLDNRAGRLADVKTDRGTFRMKSNRKGD